MKQVSASEFRTHCLAMMESVAASGEALEVTRNGRAITRLVTCKQLPVRLIGLHRDDDAIRGDIVGPLHRHWQTQG